MANPRKNPIERRIDLLTAHWEEFAGAPDARLLRWLTDDDGARLLDAFYEMHTEDEQSPIPDLFLRIHAPFTASATYGREVAAGIESQYAADRDALQAEGVQATWQCPAPEGNETGDAFLLRCCASIQQHYSDAVRYVVLVLEPASVTDYAEWQRWLHAVLASRVPETVRLAVLDRAAGPVLHALAQHWKGVIVSIAPQLRMDEAHAEVLSELSGSGPGFEYRKLFFEACGHADRGEMQPALERSGAALKIAQEQKWLPLQVVIYMFLGAAYVRINDLARSVKAYQAARAAGEQSKQIGDPAGSKLIVQSLFGEAAAYLQAGQFGNAARIYEAAVPVAAESDDATLTLEAWRMASYCHEQAGDIDSAWRCGWHGLDSAERMKPEIRNSSTLPYLAEGLQRITQHAAYAAYRPHLNARLQQLAGEQRQTTGAPAV